METGLQKILDKYQMSHEDLQTILDTDDAPDNDFHFDVYSYYVNSGDMPYAIAKARDGDPDEWIYERLITELED